MKIDYYEDSNSFYIVPIMNNQYLCYSYPLSLIEEYCSMHDQTKEQVAQELWRHIQNDQGENNDD